MKRMIMIIPLLCLYNVSALYSSDDEGSEFVKKALSSIQSFYENPTVRQYGIPVTLTVTATGMSLFAHYAPWSCVRRHEGNINFVALGLVVVARGLVP